MEPHCCDEDLDLPPSAQQPPPAPVPDIPNRGRQPVRTIATRREPFLSTSCSTRLALPGHVATVAKETSKSHTKDAFPIASHHLCIINGNNGHDHTPSLSLMASVTPLTDAKANPSVPSISGPTSAGLPIRTFFDPWNSSSTGHQKAENRLSGSTSWRESRNLKLREQYRGGLGGGAARVADAVGAGSENFGKDGRKANSDWESGAKGLRGAGQKSLREVWGASKAVKAVTKLQHIKLQSEARVLIRPGETSIMASSRAPDWEQDVNHTVQARDTSSSCEPFSKHAEEQVMQDANQTKRIFEGLCFYLNGSTAPAVSDHKLKQLLAERGANMSIALGRRSVTHVILGTPNSHRGSGGGLAASKLQKEMTRIGGKGVKFVSVDW